ncbi:MAG TPA: carboxypeptidase-like regulatory domain-containing protein [Burkholderiales bacterium]
MRHIHRTLTAVAVATTVFAGPLASFAADVQLPPEQRQGQVTFVTGGVGSDEWHAFERAQNQYPLTLEFAKQAQPRAEFLSDVQVVIQDMKGNEVLNTRTQGPFLLANLPQGEYKVTARYEGNTRQSTVKVDRASHRRVIFEWA